MPYQSIKNSYAQDHPSAKWMLTAATVLSVVTFIVLKTLIWAPQPTKESPQSDPMVTAASTIAAPPPREAETPHIDPASVSDGRPLPPPPVQINPAAGAETQHQGLMEIAPQSLGSPDAIKTLLSQLSITAVTDNKAIINGLLFEAGDFIDAGRQLKLISQNQGNLAFEVNGTRYSHKLPY